jgi:Sec-independent protein secretion pathway component TatC
MDTTDNASRLTPRAKLSTLWILVLFNMVFADIVGFMNPGALERIMTGAEAAFEITQGLLVVFAVLLEIPIVMIFLSRSLSHGANRWANTVASVITTLFVVLAASGYLSYYFFASVEVICMVLIVWYAWHLPQQAA